MNRRSFIKAASAMAVGLVIPKELELLPIPDDIEFKSVSMWVDGNRLSNVMVFDFPLSQKQVYELYQNVPRDSNWHHVVIQENEVEPPSAVWLKHG